MLQLLIIADDFTGALDTGVQFTTSGAKTKVITPPLTGLQAIAQDIDVLVIDAETRHLTTAEAYPVIQKIVTAALALDVPYIYKKTDSALRGNVGAELAALLETSGETQLPFLPAYPQIGRYTMRGVHYIDGVPVEKSVFGDDPFEPVRSSAISELIWSQSKVPVRSLPALTAQAPLPQDKGILVFDAASVEELEITGRRLLEGERLHIMAGCAGFGAVIPALLGLKRQQPCKACELNPSLLVICGSVNSITVSQLEHAVKHGFTRVHLTPEQKLQPEYWQTAEGQAALQQILQQVRHAGRCIIDSNDVAGGASTAEYANRQQLEIEQMRIGVAQSLGYIVSNLTAGPDTHTLLITGGDTLLQCMNYMQVHEMEPLEEIYAGVVVSRFERNGHQRYVISKSGGFGSEDLLTELADRLRQRDYPVN